MQSRSVRIVGYALITLVVGAFGLAVLAAVMEFTGLSRSLYRMVREDAPEQRELYETGYYGEVLDADPYDAFDVQHLHPYYFFSLPWLPDDIAAANNPYVTITSSGFRDSGVADADADAMLLGGSSAFGHYTSSDRHSLAWRLNELTGYRWANRNAPSWNSHQELVAAAKFPHDYKLSLSFTLINDVETYCAESGGSPLIDQPESFGHMAEYFGDVRAEPLKEIPKGGFFERLLPNTTLLIGTLTGSIRPEDVAKRTVGKLGPFCRDERNEVHAKAIAESFLANQKQIARLAEARGGRHLVVLQPSYVLYAVETPTAKLTRQVYDLVLSDPWCATRCLDLSRIPGIDQPVLFDGTNVATAEFNDKVHLTDRGIEAALRAIVPFIQAGE